MKWFLIFLFICNIGLYSARLNDFGHIIPDNQVPGYRIELINETYLIHYNGKSLKGNSLYNTSIGFLTLENQEVDLPTCLRLYNQNFELIYKEYFQSIINLNFSPNKKYTAFCSGENLVVLCNETGKAKTYFSSYVFSVDDSGNPAFSTGINSFTYEGKTYNTNSAIRKIIFLNSTLYIFTESGLYLYSGNELYQLTTFRGIFFDAEIDSNTLYYSTKEVIEDGFHYTLHSLSSQGNPVEVGNKIYSPNSTRTHTPIRTPLDRDEENYEGTILLTYGTVQGWMNQRFPHRAVDFIGEVGENVFSVQNGYVKNIYTTGGTRYWQILISNDNTDEQCEGYLYVHLDSNSFPYSIGEYIESGSVIGQLVLWSTPGQEHVHFSRITHSGETWSNNYATPDNVLLDCTNFADNDPPVFKNTYNNGRFAFRDNSGYYQNPDSLSGDLQVITKCYDLANYSWEVGVYELGYSLHPAGNTDFTIFEQLSFRFDFPFSHVDSWDNFEIIETVYSLDLVCRSGWSHSSRNYYYIVSNSNGDERITASDKNFRFETANYPDGEYLLKVFARDETGNETVADMEITLRNENYNVTPFINLGNDTLAIIQGDIAVMELQNCIYDILNEFDDLDIEIELSNNNISYTFDGQALTLNAENSELGQSIMRITAANEFGLSTDSVVVIVKEATYIMHNCKLGKNSNQLTNFPNPFNPSTNISFTLNSKANCNLAIYNIRGELVKALINREMDKGTFNIQWDGVSDNGNPVSSGIYFARLRINSNIEQSIKLILIK